MTLTKIVDAKPAQPYTFTNAFTVPCPRCEQTYWLGYSGEEWRKLRHWRVADA